MQELVLIHKSELRAEIADVLKEQLGEFASLFKSLQPPTKEELFYSRKQTAQKLGVSLNTLNDWTKSGVIRGHRINSRVRYKSSDIEQALKEIKSVRAVA